MANKRFGVRELNILSGSGTPNITSPGNLNLNAVQVSVSTDFSIGGNASIAGVVTAALFVGDASGLTNVPPSENADFAPTSGVSTSVIGGIGSITSLNVSGISTLRDVTVTRNLNISGILTSPNINVNGKAKIINDGPQTGSSNVLYDNCILNVVSDNTSNNGFSGRSTIGFHGWDGGGYENWAIIRGGKSTSDGFNRDGYFSVEVLTSLNNEPQEYFRVSQGGLISIHQNDVNAPSIVLNAATGIVSATTFFGDVVGNITGSIFQAVNLTGGYADSVALNVSGVATVLSGQIRTPADSSIRIGNLPVPPPGSPRNIGIGDQVLNSVDGGSGRNIGIGELSLYDVTNGAYNIGLGVNAGQNITTGSFNVIIGGYDGNSQNLDIRTSSGNIVISDGQGNVRQYINSLGNVGINTISPSEALTVAGVVSATSFYGTLNASQLSGSLPAIDGSSLIGVVATGSGVEVQEDGSPVGTAATINFGTNVSISLVNGTATVSGASSVSAATTAYNLAGTPNLNVGVVTATRLNVTGDLLVLPRGTSKGIHFGVPPYDDGANDSVIFVSDTTNPGELVLNSGDYNTKIIGNNLIFRSNFADQCSIGTETSYLLSNVGIGSTQPTSKLTVTGDGKFTGVVTATSFSGSGANLTNLPAGQLTGALPAIDGSALLNVNATGDGVVVEDSTVNVGSAKTINFGTGLEVTYSSSGIATVNASAGSLKNRLVVSGVTTSIPNLGIGNTDITGFKSYALMKVGLSTAGWLRLYTDSASRSADVSRSVGEDPAPGSGVIAEIITTGISTTQIISPFVMGGNLDDPADTKIYASIKNLSGSTQSITANLTILQLED